MLLHRAACSQQQYHQTVVCHAETGNPQQCGRLDLQSYLSVYVVPSMSGTCTCAAAAAAV